MSLRRVRPLGFMALSSIQPSSRMGGLTVHGTLDLGFGRDCKDQGDVSGTVHSIGQGAVQRNAVASPRASLTRLSPSLSAQSLMGLKGDALLGPLLCWCRSHRWRLPCSPARA